MVWTGNARRQPAFRSIECREPKAGLPNTDRVMEQGLIFPSNHSLSDEDVDYVWATAEAYLP
jgi:dTDP-4-amino-4,6-dideoxygalactose transaminase